mgnify:CR=1 FL=1|jgi:hypothetical protein
MWIGFVVIISGVGINFLPTSIRTLFDVSNVRDIAIAGGTVIEIISALFLWVYRSSINQLTYFYNRQMDNHNVLVCQRIAETMDEPDETKKVIIERIMERGQGLVHNSDQVTSRCVGLFRKVLVLRLKYCAVRG